jgi:hypothetical protein
LKEDKNQSELPLVDPQIKVLVKDGAQKAPFQDVEINLKMELLKNISLAQITNYIQQQVSQNSTHFTDSY